MEDTSPAVPQIIVIGGPNGAGKSTVAARLIPPTMEFVNADEIAKTLAESVTDSVNVQAGRLMLQRLDELEAQRASFAIETTLASRSLAPRIQRLQTKGYVFSLAYMWVPDVELSIARVAERVRRGGHHIPEDVIRRRYKSGLQNFFNLYRPIADVWGFYANIHFGQPEIVAEGEGNGTIQVNNLALWLRVQQEAENE
jgi:predicted ABC-type ATPase